MRLNVLLGELFLERGLLNREQLDKALDLQKHTGESLGQIVTRLGLISEQDLGKILSEQLGLPYIAPEDI